MSIDNGVVVLTPNVPAHMRFSALHLGEDVRKDPKTKFSATVKRLSAQVIELNGVQVMTVFDTLAEKLIAQLQPYMNDANLAQRMFTITRSGSGYLTEYTVAVT